jgi:hypothetical protein
MKPNKFRFLNIALLAGTMLAPVAIAPLAVYADDRKYRDERNHDEHAWNNHEDRAYRLYLRENHRRYTNFERLREEDRQNYWAWRHNHSDAILKINIR